MWQLNAIIMKLVLLLNKTIDSGEERETRGFPPRRREIGGGRLGEGDWGPSDTAVEERSY